MATRESTRHAARNRAHDGANGERADGGGGKEPRAGKRPTSEAVLNDGLGGGGPRSFPGLAAVKLAAGLARKPQAVAQRGGSLAAEVARIAVGTSELEPEKGDRRFKDKGWKLNPAFRRLLQAYLAAGKTVDELIDDAGLDWRAEQRVRFAASNLLDALAPSNFPLSNPTVLKAVIDSGGLNFVQGLRHLVEDARGRPFLPASVDGSEFEVGHNLAATGGAVVFRNEVFELLQYEPQTAQVRETPLMLVPQMINKYYIADLAPGKSVLEWVVGQGQQTFA